MPGRRPGRSGTSQADGAPVELVVDSGELKQFARLLQAEADPKRLRRELAKELRGALAPAVVEAKGAVTSLPHSSSSRATPALGPSIARQIRAEVRLSGRSTGARVKARKLRNVRDFPNAPKLTNRDHWRRRVFGSDTWTTQTGKPGWFDDSMRGREHQYRAAVMSVINAWAARIARRT